MSNLLPVTFPRSVPKERASIALDPRKAMRDRIEIMYPE
jgi:hypothetical protein